MRGFLLALVVGVGTAIAVGFALLPLAGQARLPAANNEALADLWQKEIARLAVAETAILRSERLEMTNDSAVVAMSANPSPAAAIDPPATANRVAAAPPARGPPGAIVAAVPSPEVSEGPPQTELAAAGAGADVADAAAAVQGLIEELQAADDLGLLTHNIPPEMEGLAPLRLTVNLSRGAAGARVLARERMRNPRILRVNDYVLVKLDGSSDFFIESVLADDRPQRVVNDDAGVWQFDVLPLNAGETELQIIVVLYDETGYDPIATFSEPVRVTISIPTRARVIAAKAADNPWVVSVGSGVVATAICGGWVAFQSRRRRPNNGWSVGS